ncbi:MAG: glycosyltransferase family 39 protein [bacterium]|nr:glycosyltransferase family 39 protein [bacterium]
MSDLRILEISLLSLLVITSYCPGLKVLKILRISPNSFLEEIIFAVGLGLGCLSFLVLGLGLVGLLYDWIFYVIFGVGLIILYPELWYFCRRAWCARCGQISISVFIPLVLTLFLAIILLLVPTITFDALVYHLAVPQTYIKHHKIVYLPDNCFSNYTFNTEMLFTLGLLLKGDLLARAIHFLFGLLSALGIYALARRYFGQRTAYWSILAFCSMPLAVFVATVAFNDFSLTFYEILAVYAFINWSHEKKHGWLLVCGLMCGLAIGTKYFGGFCFIILSLSILWVAWQQQGPLKALKTTAIFAILVLLPNLPWLIKNLVFTGNPVFPLFYPVLGGKNWSQFHYTRYLYEMTRYSDGYHLFLKPFIFLWDISFKQGGGMDSGIKLKVGPIFLSLLPFLLAKRKLDFSIKYLLAFCGVFFLFWSYVCAVDRFALPCFVLLCVVVGYTIERFKGKRLYPCLLAILFISLVLNLGYVLKVIHKNAYFMCLKKVDTEKFLLEKSIIKDYYDVISHVNRHLPAQSKVLFIGEVRSYYCQRDKLVATQFDTNIILKLIRKSKGIEGLLWNLKQLGVTHVLYNETGARWLIRYFDYFHWKNNEEKELYNLFMQNHLRLIYCHGAISLFEIPELD